MTARSRTHSRIRFVVAATAFVVGALTLTVQAQPPDPGKKVDPVAKTGTKDKDAPAVKLPDGTFLWLGTPTDGNGERVTLTPAELHKLLDQLDQLKKQLAAKKTVAPSGCAIRGRVEKRGEQFVALLKLTCTFRTTAPQAAVSLGGRKGFLVAAALDGNKLPVLDTSDDGFAVLVEAAGDHTLTLDLEAPVSPRGAKPELGFEIGLPRAPITTLALDPPSGDVKRVNLATRTPDPTKPTAAEPRRTPALDIKQLASKPGQDGYALGPIDSLEVTWDPPASAAQPADQVQSAEIDVAVLLTEGLVESTARFKLRGPAREWKLVAPAAATDVSVERAPGGTDVGPTLSPTVTKPTDPNKPVWKVEFPTGSPATDWVVTVVTRLPRPKPDDPRHRGPFPIGPLAVLDVLRQTGTVRVTTAPNTRFTFTHGPDLRKCEPFGPVEDDQTAAFFRLTTGPTGTTPVNAPLFSFQAVPQQGGVAVKPTYRLTLTDAGWRVRAEVRVLPIRTEVEAVAVDVPAEWRGFEVSPRELVDGVQQGVGNEGFWAGTALRLVGGLRVPVVVRLAARSKQPFDLVFTALVPFDPGESTLAVPFPRFPSAEEKEPVVTATVPDGLEIRGETRSWDGEFGAWGAPLAPAPGPDGRPMRVATTATTTRAEGGVARVVLNWTPHRPDITADARAAVTIGERQLVVEQRVTLRSAEGFSRPVRFRGPPGVIVSSKSALSAVGKDEWQLPASEAKELSLAVTFAVPLPPRPPDGAAWKVPVGLFWPVGVSRPETTVRVWSSAATGRTLVPATPGWRELAVDAVPDREPAATAPRDTLPSLTLAGSGTELPLALEVREFTDPGAVAVWVERGLVQAWAAGDGVTEYRVRFVLRRWLTPSVELRLPGPLAGPNPEFRRDGLKVEAVPVHELASGGRAFRVPLPEAAAGKVTVVEVRYQLPAAGSGTGEAVYQPPVVPAAAFVGAVRWQVTVATGSIPLLTAGATPEFRWRLRSGGLAPAPVASTDGLEKWFRGGDEPSGDDPNGETVTARQATLAPVTLYRGPRLGFILAASVAGFVVVLAVSRLPGWAIGPVIAVLCGVAGIAAVFWPHLAAQLAGASQPGFAGAVAVLLVIAAAKLVYRRRVTRLPGFTRTLPTPSVPPAPIPSSARKLPSVLGSSGAHSPTPAGG